jgi:hypothetical protein
VSITRRATLVQAVKIAHAARKAFSADARNAWTISWSVSDVDSPRFRPRPVKKHRSAPTAASISPTEPRRRAKRRKDDATGPQYSEQCEHNALVDAWLGAPARCGLGEISQPAVQQAAERLHVP